MIHITNSRVNGGPPDVIEQDKPGPRAFTSLVQYELGYGGRVIEIEPTRLVAQTRVMDTVDTVTFSGPEDEMRPLYTADLDKGRCPSRVRWPVKSPPPGMQALQVDPLASGERRRGEPGGVLGGEHSAGVGLRPPRLVEYEAGNDLAFGMWRSSARMRATAPTRPSKRRPWTGYVAPATTGRGGAAGSP